MKDVDVAIIGGGPAGMAAAIELAQHNVNFTLIDSYSQLGGHYFKQMPSQLTTSIKQSPRQTEFEKLAVAIEKQSVCFLAETSVWTIFPDQDCTGFTLHLTGPHNTDALHTRYLLLAPGAYDRPLAFPGWELPGVITLGGAQMLLKGHGIRPGERALVAGSGPLLLAAAAALVEAGTKVVAVLDFATFGDGLWKAPAAFWGQWARIRDAWHYLSILRRHRVPIHFGQTIFKAEGDSVLSSATFGKVDDQWRPHLDSAQSVAVDTVCVALGFLPNLALTRHLGCDHRYDPRLDAFYPVHNAAMESSVPGVYVAGDVTGMGGKDLSMLQGRLAAFNILGKLAEISPSDDLQQRNALSHKLAREERFLNMLSDRMEIRAGLDSLITQDTVVCRCEMVRAHEIESAVLDGARDLKSIKLRTRCGMGACQGRYCEPHTRRIVASKRGKTPEQVGVMAVRPPLIPTQIEDLLAS